MQLNTSVGFKALIVKKLRAASGVSMRGIRFGLRMMERLLLLLLLLLLFKEQVLGHYLDDLWAYGLRLVK